MATAYDGLGMGQLGKESQYYSGSNPFKEAMKGLKDFAIISGIQKSGLQDFLNSSTGKDKPAIGTSPTDYGYSAARDAMIPSVTSTMNAPSTVTPNTPEVSAPILQNPDAIQDQANKAFGISSFVSPDAFKPRDPGFDQTPLQMASAPTQPLNLPQYGKQNGGGGIDLAKIASIAQFFI
jgi:hypothetical protein